MSEIQHTNRAHARLNASSSHRWMMCPPSVRLSEQFEDKYAFSHHATDPAGGKRTSVTPPRRAS